MSKTIHIKGFANKIDIESELSSNYSLEFNFYFGEKSEETIDNVFFRFYECEKECTLEEALENHVSKMFGKVEAEGEAIGYSEYTIEGFNIYSLRLGDHDIGKIIKSKGSKYLHILIDVVENHA